MIIQHFKLVSTKKVKLKNDKWTDLTKLTIKNPDWAVHSRIEYVDDPKCTCTRHHQSLVPNQGCRNQGSEGERNTLPLCVEVGFYVDISWESRCNIEVNIWAHFYMIF